MENGKYVVPENKYTTTGYNVFEVVMKHCGVELKGMNYVKKANTLGKDYTVKITEKKKKGKVVSGFL